MADAGAGVVEEKVEERNKSEYGIPAADYQMADSPDASDEEVLGTEELTKEPAKGSTLNREDKLR